MDNFFKEKLLQGEKLKILVLTSSAYWNYLEGLTKYFKNLDFKTAIYLLLIVFIIAW